MTIFGWRGPGFPGKLLELERMRNYMENVYSSLSSGVNQIRRNYTGVFPLINLSEDDDNLYLTAELPGIDPQGLDLSVKNDTLTLKGAKKNDTEPSEVNFHRRERELGSFRRSITLPTKVQVEAVDAKFKNGILTVTLPKAAEAKAHQITITT
ncbi:MAG: Hsp20/alpha crystallin family protein [Deltaproteobacteria bacterium]|jgi:HSP20 family protein|nr:Hsp20/alpha crystallin family protein [Deltaproteobacteria bacterium]